MSSWIAEDRAWVHTTLADVHDTFRRWLGAEYDLAAIDAVLATAAPRPRVKRGTGRSVRGGGGPRRQWLPYHAH